MTRNEAKQEATNAAYAALANDISEYVQANLSERISIETLSVRHRISKFHLNRIFHATTGFQLGEFVQRRRLQMAYAMLSSKTASITDTALAAGYESHASFSRAFRQAFGRTPSHVRSDSTSGWVTPNTIKRPYMRAAASAPTICVLPEQRIRGVYGQGFNKNSYVALATHLKRRLDERLATAGVSHIRSRMVGVSLDSPWQVPHGQARFFIGIVEVGLPVQVELDDYIFQAGTWARFNHRGGHGQIWQTISRIYARWVLPKGVRLREEAVVQAYLNDPATTPQDELMTELYFPISA